MCLVETGTRDEKTGKINMLPKLVPACNTPVRDGTVVVTQKREGRSVPGRWSKRICSLRHPIDCPICDKAGECMLQDYHFRYGQKERRADILPFTSRRRDVGTTSRSSWIAASCAAAACDSLGRSAAPAN